MNEFRINTSNTGGSALTGSGAINLTIQPPISCRLLEARLSLDEPATDLSSFAINLDSGLGAAWDSILAAPDPVAQDLSVVTSWRYADPVPPIVFHDDRIVVSWPNAGGVTWALDIIVDAGK